MRSCLSLSTRLLQTKTHRSLHIKKGLFIKSWKVDSKKRSPRIPLLMAEFHVTPTGGHSGHLGTYKRMAAFLYWEGMKKQIQEYVSKCVVCEQNKYGRM